MNSVNPPCCRTIIGIPPSTQRRAEGVNTRVDQVVAGHLRLVANLGAAWIGEGPGEGVLGPFLIDLARRCDGHGLPGRAAVVGGEPVQGSAAGDIHLRIDLCGLHALGQFVFAGDVSAGGVVQISDQVDVLEVERWGVVGLGAAEHGPHQNIRGDIRQVLLLGRHDGVPGGTKVGGILPDDAGPLRDGGILVEVQLAELRAADGQETHFTARLELVAVNLDRKIGTVERRPGLGVGAFQQDALGIALAGDDTVLPHLAQGGDANPVIGAVGEQHHRVAGVRLRVEGIVEGDLGFRAQVDLGRGDDLFGQHDLVGQTGGHAADLDGDRNGRVLLGELHTHRGDDAVLSETEGLRQGIAPSGSPAPAPDGADHRHTDDARRHLLDDGLPLDDGAVHHDALDAGDHQRIVDLQIGLRRISAVVDFDDAVPVTDIRGNGEGGDHPSGCIGIDVGGDHLSVATQGDSGRAGREIGAHHRDAGLSPPADVRCDLNRRLRLFEHRVRIDVLVFGPVGLFDQDLFRSGKQHEAPLEQRVACGLVHLEHLG
ncbi:hypothetical protein DESC_510051 [Desulfosarcina cetonica]|nr:hypothetical protein DESC_510051 [Desulfosarcina cetonica]